MEGIYDYHSKENFDAYLKELGVPWYLRKAAGLASPTITISKIDQGCSSQWEAQSESQEHTLSNLHTPTICPTRWNIRTDTMFRSHEVSFALNETVSDTTMDGRSITMVVILSKPNQWREVQTSLTNGKETTLVRNFLPNKMDIKMLVGNVEASSTFLRRN